MTIPQQAIEAAANAMSKASSGFFSGEAWRFLAQESIKASRPHIEADLRTKIAAEIRDDVDHQGQPKDNGRNYFQSGMERAARIAEGKQ